MLVQSKRLVGARILSLHTGQAIGQIQEIIINPDKLLIAGFYVASKWHQKSRNPIILLPQNIREVAGAGVLINSIDDLTELDELVRLKDIATIKFELVGKAVVTESKQRLGKVDEYVINTADFVVQKIYVKQSLFKSMNFHSLVIDRQQIVEVTDKRVVVSDTSVVEPLPTPAQA